MWRSASARYYPQPHTPPATQSTTPRDGQQFQFGHATVHRFGQFQTVALVGDDVVQLEVTPAKGGRNNKQTHVLKEVGEGITVDGWGTLTLIETTPPQTPAADEYITGGGTASFRYNSPSGTTSTTTWPSWCALVLAIAGLVFSLIAWRRNRTTVVTKSALGGFIATWLGISGFVWISLGVVCDLVKLPRSFAVPLWAQITGLTLIAASLAAIYLLPKPKCFNRLYQRVLWIVLGLGFIMVAPNPVVVVAGIATMFGHSQRRYRPQEKHIDDIRLVPIALPTRGSRGGRWRTDDRSFRGYAPNTSV